VNRRIVLVMVGMLFLSRVGYGADDIALPFDCLVRNPEDYQGAWVIVRGFVAIDGLGHQYLFDSLQNAKEKKYEKSIDLMPIVGEEGVMEVLKDAACADIYGKFKAYGKHFLPTGYLLSGIGLIEVKRISVCPNK